MTKQVKLKNTAFVKGSVKSLSYSTYIFKYLFPPHLEGQQYSAVWFWWRFLLVLLKKMEKLKLYKEIRLIFSELSMGKN